VRGGDEADHLVDLFEACHHVLRDLGEVDAELTHVIRETCDAVERRLAKLGVVADDPYSAGPGCIT
jgi:hypothetical protein